jgi:transposase
LCTVLTDVFSKTGYAILKGIVENKTQEEITKTLPKKTRKNASLFFEQIPSHIPDSAIFLIDSMLKVYDNLQVGIKRIEERMKFYMKGSERQITILMSVPGIGFVLSSNILTEIGDINDFPSSDKLAKWAGITPIVYQSANTNHTGSITKQGSKYLRWALVEAAHSAVKRAGKLNDYFNSLLPKKGYKKAIVAVARKMLRIIWHLLVNDEMYVDKIPRVKKIQLPKIPEKTERIGVAKILQLLSRGAELIVQEEGKEIMRINGSSQVS